jgi:SAM-dependent methyltransferase
MTVATPIALPTVAPIAPSSRFERVVCYLCGADDAAQFITAQDDYTGKPGRFTFVTCRHCGLHYQNPRLTIDEIKFFYDDEYIAHRKKSDWGVLTGFFNWAMGRHDRQKTKIVRRFVSLEPGREVLDVGCAVGTFLQHLRSCHGVSTTGVDFKDLSGSPSLAGVDFRCGLFYEQDFGSKRFDLITMWHFLEHDYDPMRTWRTARDLLRPDGRLIIEVPRLDSTTFRLFGRRWPGLQAPQHTVLFDRRTLLATMDAGGTRGCRVSAVRSIPGLLLFLRRRRLHGCLRQGPRPRQGDLSLLRGADPHVAAPRLREATQLRDADGCLPAARMRRVVLWLRVAATFALMTIGALVMLIVAIPTAFVARRLLLRSNGACARRDGAAALGSALSRTRHAPAAVAADRVHREPQLDARLVRVDRTRPAAYALLSQRLSEKDAADRYRRRPHSNLLDGAAGVSQQAPCDLQAR